MNYTGTSPAFYLKDTKKRLQRPVAGGGWASGLVPLITAGNRPARPAAFGTACFA
jgi:hypothetical protein